jgi:hypothetical protein
MLACAVAACTATRDEPTEAPPTTSGAPTAPPSSAAPSTQRHELTCGDQLTPTAPPSKSIPRGLGLASDGWIGSSELRFEHGIDTAAGTYDGFKTYTYVTRSAAARTTIRIVAPRDGLLFYTSGYVWSSGLADAEVLRDATRSVTLQNCRDKLQGYAGELLLKRPSCTRLLIVSHRRSTDIRQRLAIPMGKPC